MSSKTLYFPNIELPESKWTLKSILYWDSVGTIMPPNYNFNELSQFNQDLFHNGFIEGVIPGDYGFNRNKFIDSVFQIMDSNEILSMDARRTNFKNGIVTKVYAKKVEHSFFHRLSSLGLAREVNRDEFLVESNTANLIMIRLAENISSSGEFQLSTDKKSLFLPALKAGKQTGDVWSQILNEVMPYPKSKDLKKIRVFKDKNHDHLIRLRIELERVAETIML